MGIRTLDEAADRFEAEPTQTAARAYRDTALQYWEDEMIGDETLLQILYQIRNTGEEKS